MGFIGPLALKGTAMAHGAAGAGAAGSPFSTAALSGLSIGVLLIALLYFVFGFIFYATLFAAAGSMVNSEQEGRQAAMPIMLLAMSGYLLLEAVMFNPNSTLSVVLSWLPWTSPILMPVRMGLTSVSPLSVAGSLTVALLGSAVAIWLSARIYRVGMLMYGKRPNLAELVKWIRYA
jgi:ABC-2 type transport system permease protein